MIHELVSSHNSLVFELYGALIFIKKYFQYFSFRSNHNNNNKSSKDLRSGKDSWGFSVFQDEFFITISHRRMRSSSNYTRALLINAISHLNHAKNTNKPAYWSKLRSLTEMKLWNERHERESVKKIVVSEKSDIRNIGFADFKKIIANVIDLYMLQNWIIRYW